MAECNQQQMGWQRFVNPLAKRLKSRLSRRIVLWVFASIITIEAAILVPSFKRRERELLAQLTEVSGGKVAWILVAYPDASPTELLDRLDEIRPLNPEILGGTVYAPDGGFVGNFGQAPQLSLENMPQMHGDVYDAVVWSGPGDRDYSIIVRHNASGVRLELIAYTGRIVGLVALISIFLTVTVWMVLEPILITPIFRLRRDLLEAGDAIRQDREPPEFYSASIQRQDELGDAIAAFQEMFRKICEAIEARKTAESALQQSLQTVEAYSQALDRELQQGRDIQRNFLPSSNAIRQVEIRTGWDIATFFQPARQVAGDFYDVFELSGGVVGLVVADVCDKGVGAALFMGLFRSLIRTFSGQTELEGLTDSHFTQANPLEAVRLTNDYIASNHGELGMFATLFFGVLDPETGWLTYVNGGHEPLLVVDGKGGVKEQLKPTGPAVGMLPGMTFQSDRVQLAAEDTLIGYTDGVTEARNAEGEFFTPSRLMTLLEIPARSAAELLDRISTNVLEHTGATEQFDDITLLAVRRMS